MPYISGSLASKERKTDTPSSSIKCEVIWVSFCEFISDEIFVFNIVFNIVLYSTAICQKSIVRWWRWWWWWWWWWCCFINDDDADYDNDDDDDDDDGDNGDMESQVRINPIIMDIHDWITDIHNWILDIHIRIIFMDIHNCIMGSHNGLP